MPGTRYLVGMNNGLTRRQFLCKTALAGAALACQPWRAVRAAVTGRAPGVRFCGAAGFVSGSSHLVDTGRYKVLLDCGLFQEPQNEQYNGRFIFDPREIDLLVLSHAHADHVGNLHHLLRQGFRGRIVTTDATRDIYVVVSENLLHRPEGNRDSRGPSESELEDIKERFLPVPYNTKTTLADDLVLRYTDAGHMLGSAFIELWFGDEKLVFTGDMGPKDAPILCAPTILRRADYVLIESTYAGVTRKREDWTRLGTIINETVEKGGSVLVPVFAAEKLQRVIYRLRQLKEAGMLSRDVRVISDSSSGNAITDVFRRYTDYYDAAAKSLPKLFNFPGLYEMTSRDSLATHGQRGIVYLSTAGMMDFANAPKHLAALCEDPRNTLIFVGYQAPHTLGGKIYGGERNVTIRWTEPDGSVRQVQKNIRMRVEKLSGFSGHADGAELLEWLGNFGHLKQVYVVHGEEARSEAMAKQIQERYGFPAMAPKLFETATLDRTEYAARRAEPAAKERFEETESYDPQDM
jgi:metallo-beta-lactamase family protein